MNVRKHCGINQQTGRLKKGYKYSGKKLKSGLPQIVKSIEQCQGYLSAKIRINIHEKRYKNNKQAIAVAFAQVKKTRPECKKKLSRKKKGGAGEGKRGPSGNKKIVFKFKKYSKTTEKIMSLLRKEINGLFKEIDWKNDIKAGIIFEKGSNKIILRFINIIKTNPKLLNEIKQAINNEYPYQKSNVIKQTFKKIKYLINKPPLHDG